MKPVRHRSWTSRHQFRQTGVISTEDQATSGLIGELAKLALDGVEVRVEVEVFGIDVQEDGVLWVEGAQRAIAFVRFDHEQVLGVWRARTIPSTQVREDA